MPQESHVHRALALIRSRRGLTLAQVAERLGQRDKSGPHGIENGNPRLGTLERYLGALESGWRELADTLDEIAGTRPASQVPAGAPLLEHLAERYLGARFDALRHDPAFRSWLLDQLAALAANSDEPTRSGEQATR